jgi:hypothetical protein
MSMMSASAAAAVQPTDLSNFINNMDAAGGNSISMLRAIAGYGTLASVIAQLVYSLD